MLAVFKEAGVPLQRIWPASAWLQEYLGLEQALASEALKTDGAEVLYDFGRRDPSAQELADGLVVVRNGQQVFRPIVRDYLRDVTYRSGWVRAVLLPGYRNRDVDVVVDPWVNGGAPTVARRGIRVSDVTTRLAAGEERPDVAEDYGLSLAEVDALANAAWTRGGGS